MSIFFRKYSYYFFFIVWFYFFSDFLKKNPKYLSIEQKSLGAPLSTN